MDNNSISTFFSRLMDLNAGEKAALKRSAGVMLNDAKGKAKIAFFKAYPPVNTDNRYYEEKLFCVACFHCFWEKEELASKLPVEKILSEYIVADMHENIANSLLKRIESILDLAWDSDGYLLVKLSRLIKLCKSKGAVIDCEELFKDLVEWNYSSKKVQKKWVKAIFTGKENDEV